MEEKNPPPNESTPTRDVNATNATASVVHATALTSTRVAAASTPVAVALMPPPRVAVAAAVSTRGAVAAAASPRVAAASTRVAVALMPPPPPAVALMPPTSTPPATTVVALMPPSSLSDVVLPQASLSAASANSSTIESDRKPPAKKGPRKKGPPRQASDPFRPSSLSREQALRLQFPMPPFTFSSRDEATAFGKIMALRRYSSSESHTDLQINHTSSSIYGCRHCTGKTKVLFCKGSQAPGQVQSTSECTCPVQDCHFPSEDELKKELFPSRPALIAQVLAFLQQKEMPVVECRSGDPDGMGRKGFSVKTVDGTWIRVVVGRRKHATFQVVSIEDPQTSNRLKIRAKQSANQQNEEEECFLCNESPANYRLVCDPCPDPAPHCSQCITRGTNMRDDGEFGIDFYSMAKINTNNDPIICPYCRTEVQFWRNIHDAPNQFQALIKPYGWLYKRPVWNQGEWHRFLPAFLKFVQPIHHECHALHLELEKLRSRKEEYQTSLDIWDDPTVYGDDVKPQFSKKYCLESLDLVNNAISIHETLLNERYASIPLWATDTTGNYDVPIIQPNHQQDGDHDDGGPDGDHDDGGPDGDHDDGGPDVHNDGGPDGDGDPNDGDPDPNLNPSDLNPGDGVPDLNPRYVTRATSIRRRRQEHQLTSGSSRRMRGSSGTPTEIIDICDSDSDSDSDC